VLVDPKLEGIARSNYIDVGGIQTHYLSAGSPDAPTLVLLHGGEFGGCSELSWEFNLEALARDFHVIAPDHVGFGYTAKLRDFSSHGSRMISHITAFIRTLGIERAHFVGNSVSGRFLCKVASAESPDWPIDRMICISGGGFEPDNEERKILQDYDGSEDSMRAILGVLFHNPEWDNAEYLARRQHFALIPGAWEVAAAARFRAPWRESRPLFGREDRTEYEKIPFPTLFAAGRHDPLLPAGYQVELEARAPRGSSALFENSSHNPQIEEAERFNRVARDFLLGSAEDE